MSCGQIALNKLGLKDYTYYASEVDKYAMQITQKNFPETIQVGDVTQLKSEDFTNIDLMFAGSPCQGFSFAGKQLAFDDPRSKLFFEFVRLLKEVKPKYFLLENVRMKKEYLDVISEQVGAQPTLINSALLSAQSRQRYYWTNIPFDKNIEDRGIVLKDILETEPSQPTLMSDKFVNRQQGRSCLIDQNKEKASNLSAMEYVKNGRQGDYLACDYDGKPKQVGIAADIKGHDIIKRVYSPEGKSPTLTTMGGGHREPKVSVQSYREVRTEEAKQIRKMTRQKTGKDHTPYRSKRLEPRTDGKVGTVTPSLNNDHKISIQQVNPSREAAGKQPYIQNRVFSEEGKSHALTASFASRTNVETKSKIRDKSKTVRSGGRGSYDRHEWDSVDELHWRKLTPLECERLQTVPDNYTESVSNTQRYKMLGNGWTVDVIAHILKSLIKS